MAYLVFYIDKERIEVPVTERDTTIGRSRECTIPIKGDPEISRIHCTIQRQEDGSYLIIDEESRNGTFLNGKRIYSNEEHTLKDGDEIRIGATKFRFYLSENEPGGSPRIQPGT